MFQTSIIASGSKGNALLVRGDRASLILDAGISGKKIFAALDRLRIDRSEIKAVLISHEHSDHCGGAGPLARMLKVPIFMTRDTFMCAQHKLGKVEGMLQWISSGEAFQIGDIICDPFSSSHDAYDSCNFVFYQQSDPIRKLGVATDLGYPTLLTTQKLLGSTTLVLESNHDEQMLIDGPYDWPLKQRVRSNKGHLSNNQAVGLLSQIYHAGLKTLILAHLSENNNKPELAFRTMKDYLDSIRSDVELLVAEPHRETRLIDI